MLVKRETEGHNIKASLRAVQNEQEINFEIKRKGLLYQDALRKLD